ncbi:MAG: DNA primase [Bacteroidia bacterium]|nr:DNA primase [Bacteroidia bacterium]
MAKRIPPEKVEEIYNAADIVEIVGDFLQLKKRGTNYFALSPFTNEKTPSFAVSPSKNIFKDFSTGKGGNAITFLMDLEGMTYVEALKYVADKYNIALELEETYEEVESKDVRDSLYILNEWAAKWFNRQLTETEDGRKIGLSYFRERGMLEGTIKEFMLGYAPDQWEALSNEALKNQFNEEYLVGTGLCFKSDKDGKLLDRFKGRIMFPIHNHLGKVLGFGGRILDKSQKAAKYINSPETEIYHKSKVLYGLYFSKNRIRDLDQAILVEGYMDVISLYQNGITNVVATSGTALTDDQIKLLKRFSKNVLLIYDADNAGINAALRGADLMIEQELAVRVLLLPPGDDPDSYVKANGKSGFEAYSQEKSKDFVEFKIDHLMAQALPNDPMAKTTVIHEVASTISRIPDPVRQSVYVQFTAEKLQVAEPVVENALRQALLSKAKNDERQARFDKARKDRESAQNSQLQIGKSPPANDYPPDMPPLEVLYPEAFANGETAIVTPPREIHSTGLTISQERELLRLLFNYPSAPIKIAEGRVEGQEVKDYIYEGPLANYLIQELEDMDFDDPVLNKLKIQVTEHIAQKGTIDVNQYLSHQGPDMISLITELLTIPIEVSKNWEKYDIKAPKMDENLDDAVYSAVMHFKLKKIKQLLKETHQKIKENQDLEKLDDLLKVYAHLNNLKQELSKELGIVIHQ